jgi:hypothetical protein
MVGCSASICMALTSSTALKTLDEAYMDRSIKGGGMRRHNSLSSAVVTVAVANSILF